jgi:hypothetical protein
VALLPRRGDTGQTQLGPANEAETAGGTGSPLIHFVP